MIKDFYVYRKHIYISSNDSKKVHVCIFKWKHPRVPWGKTVACRKSQGKVKLHLELLKSVTI